MCCCKCSYEHAVTHTKGVVKDVKEGSKDVNDKAFTSPLASTDDVRDNIEKSIQSSRSITNTTNGLRQLSTKHKKIWPSESNEDS